MTTVVTPRTLPLSWRERIQGLVPQAPGNVVLNLAYAGLNIGITVVLSRLLGSEGYGSYAFAIAMAAVLSIPGVLGLPSLVVRELSKYRLQEAWGYVRGLTRRANQAAILASVVLATGTAGVCWWLNWPAHRLFEPTLVALPLVPLIAVTAIRQSAMQAFGQVVKGRLPETLIGPFLLVVVIGGFYWFSSTRLSAQWSVGLQVVTTSVAAALGLVILRRSVPSRVWRAGAQFETRAWAVALLPLALASGIGTLNAQIGTVLVGALGGARQAGIFAVGVRVSGVIPFLLVAVTPALMPVIAQLHAKGDRARLQDVAARTSKAVLLVSLPAVVVLLAFPVTVLRLFGSDFVHGSVALRWLCVGQLVNVATGFGGTIALMVDESAIVTWSVAVGAALNVALAILLVPTFGASGAAAASAVSLSCLNVMVVVLLWRRRGIYTPGLRVRLASGRTRQA